MLAAGVPVLAALGWVVGGGLLPRPAAGQHRGGGPAVQVSADARFDALAQRYFDAYIEQSPVRATQLGVHRYDHLLDDLSPESLGMAAQRFKAMRTELSGLDPARLSPARRIDARLLRLRLDSDLLELDDLQGWRRNPMQLAETISGGLHELLARDFAPLDERLGLLVARQGQLPKLVAQAKKNLENPPEIFTRKAIDMVQGVLKLLREQVLREAGKSQNAALLADVKRSNAEAVRTLDELVRWMKRDLLPRSRGRYALGAERLRRKLAADEGLDVDLARLEELGRRELARTRAALEALGGKATLARLASDHGGPADLLPDTRRTLEELRRFVIDKQLVRLPAEARCQLAPMPDFMFGFASMSSPGPFETRAGEAYFYVDPVRPGWPRARQQAHLAAFNRTFMKIVSIHEAYPGHFVQGLHARRAPSVLRQIAGGNTLVEGWAHYAEQMVLDEGYRRDDPLLRASQLREAMVRLGRYLASIQLHAHGHSVAAVERFFEHEVLVDSYTAHREAERGTHNPMYLVYSLGKLQILKLRDDYRRRFPGRSLADFHDALLGQGQTPVAMIRTILLGDDAGPSL
jgi:uncharacterized protein (DUF885 family)